MKGIEEKGMRTRVESIKKFISSILSFAVIFCALFGFHYEVRGEEENTIPIACNSLSEQLPELTEILRSEEITSSALWAVFIKQSSTRKVTGALPGVSVLINTVVPVISVSFLSFLHLGTDRLEGSHRFIMEYIHQKDGQK